MGATSCRQGEESWKLWKAGVFGDVSLSDGIIEYAKTHEEIKGAFLTFQKDADQIYPGWKEKLGYTGESSVQAATFDWAKKASATAFVGSTGSASSKSCEQKTCMQATGFMYSYQKDVYQNLEFGNDVGYFPDGTAINRAGNEVNHPENIKPDRHVAGSALPCAKFTNDIGYLPDGTPLNKAGNETNHPENQKPDPHKAGSPLPPSPYAADVGYFVDGTPLDKAGNANNH